MTYFPQVKLLDPAGGALPKQRGATPGSDYGIPLLGVRQNALAVLNNNGTYIPVVVDTNGRLYVNSLQVDTNGVSLAKAEDAVAADGDFGMAALAIRKDVPTSLVSADGDYSLFELDAQGRVYTAGQVAHGASIQGNPVRTGGRARTSELTAVSNDQQVDALFDEFGKQVIIPYSIPSKWTDGYTAAITGTSDTAVIAAPGASLFLNITWLLVTNSHATVGTVVQWKSGSTVRGQGYAAPVGQGFMISFRTPIKIAANTAFNVACVTTSSNVYASAGGFISGS